MWACLQVRCELKPLALHLEMSKPLSPQLDAQYDKQKFSVLIVTNPNNPTGEVILKAKLQEYLEWCCRKGVHLIR